MQTVNFQKIVVLTGAGISAESGLPTFRGPDGIWQGQRVEEIASPAAFRSNPQRVHDFYNWRRRALLAPTIHPNPAHFALAKLAQTLGPERFFLVTQNVDDLHERAGSRQVLHMHGELLKIRCTETGNIWDWRDDLHCTTPHPEQPELQGTLRPHIVWFGEQPFRLPEIYARLRQCDCFIAVGTSGQVYPAAGFVQETPRHCHRIELNLDPTPLSTFFHEHRQGSASELLPCLVRELLG
jgi:NAD-dependent deacetylase